MAFIGSLFDGSKGSGFEAKGTNIVSPSTQAQADQTYAQQQGSYAQQDQLMQALKAQGGLNKQSDTYNQIGDLAKNGSALAGAQLTGATNQGIQQAAGTVASQKGLNPALAARMAGQQAGQSTQQAANQAAQMQAGVQMNALGQQAGMANQMAGQQVGQTNNMTQTAMGMNGQVLGGIQGQNNANVAMQSNQNNANAGVAQANAKGQSDLVGGLLNSAGSAATMISDERAKTDIHPGDSKIQAMLDSLQPHDYKYKESAQDKPGAGSGRHISPMAQELESTEAGKDMVVQGPDGTKTVDYGKGFGTIMAAQALLNKRLEALEGGGKQKLAQGGEVQFDSPSMDMGSAPQPAPAAQVQPVAAPSVPKPAPSHPLSKLFSKSPAADPSQGAMFNGASAFGTGLASAIGNIFASKVPEQAAPTPSAPAPQDTGALTGNDYSQPANKMFGVSSAQDLSKAMMAKGGQVPAMVSPGEIYLKPEEAREVAAGVKSPMDGEMIPGKAKVKGNSLKNDTVPKTLESGGVVIPKDILEGKNPHREAYKFVNAVLGKNAMKRKSS